MDVGEDEKTSLFPTFKLNMFDHGGGGLKGGGTPF